MSPPIFIFGPYSDIRYIIYAGYINNLNNFNFRSIIIPNSAYQDFITIIYVGQHKEDDEIKKDATRRIA